MTIEHTNDAIRMDHMDDHIISLLAFCTYTILWSLLIAVLVLCSNVGDDIVPMVRPSHSSEDLDEDDDSPLTGRSPSNTEASSSQERVRRLDSMYYSRGNWNEWDSYEWRGDEIFATNDQMFEQEMMVDSGGMTQPVVIHDDDHEDRSNSCRFE
jgi:hypothetical protein